MGKSKRLNHSRKGIQIAALIRRFRAIAQLVRGEQKERPRNEASVGLQVLKLDVAQRPQTRTNRRIPNRSNTMTKIIWTALFAVIAFGCGDIQAQAQSTQAPVDSQFNIMATTKGGCELGQACPSYQISADGSYVYTQPGIFGGATKTLTGTLAANENSELSKLITQNRLSTLKTSKFTGTCPSFNDDTDYVFDITLAGQETNLHSCKNALSEDPLAMQLTMFFNVFSRKAKENE